jgi:hypothetical protein
MCTIVRCQDVYGMLQAVEEKVFGYKVIAVSV